MNGSTYQGTTLSTLLLRTIGQMGDLVQGGRGCFFTFHRAAPSSGWATLPNRGFYLDLDFLDRLLGYLVSSGWDIVTVEEALRRAGSGERERNYVNFSVDDCYRDTHELVIPLFRRHRVPVTIFLTTGIPDGTLTMWQAGLEQILRDHSIVTLDGAAVDVASDERKRQIYEALARLWDGPQAAEHYAAFCAANGADAETLHWQHAMDWEMLERVAADPYVEIGGHTVSHRRISTLAEADAFHELEGCRTRIEERLSIPVRHFAFPFGRSGDCGPRDFELARKAGYASAATTTKGLVRKGANPFRLPRNTLNGRHRSLPLAELHLTGMTGLAARVLNRV